MYATHIVDALLIVYPTYISPKRVNMYRYRTTGG